MIFNISVTTLENSQCKYEISHFKKSDNIGQIALFLVNLYKKTLQREINSHVNNKKMMKYTNIYVILTYQKNISRSSRCLFFPGTSTNVPYPNTRNRMERGCYT